MKTKIYHQKRKYIQAEKKLEKKHYNIIAALIIFTFVYHVFIEPKTIGGDIKYSLFVFWVPTLIGMLFLGFYRRQFLINRFATTKGVGLWTFMIVFYLIQGIMFSYLSFGQVAKVSFDIINYQLAKQSTEETIQCDVKRFWTKRTPSVNFEFERSYESFKVRYQELKVYEDKDAADYLVTIKAQKGIWNHYIVKEWRIVKK